MRATFFAVLYIWIQLQSLVQGHNSENSTENEAQDSSRRVLFGRLAPVLDFPFQVYLQIGDGYCGGSIIADQWVNTAAHCTSGKNCNGILIRAAVWGPQETVSPIECHNHPQFDPVRFTYDISLLKVQVNLIGDGRAKAISLPNPGTYYAPGTPATIVGWGKTEQGIPPSQLLFADVKVKDWESCNRYIRTINPACQGNQNCLVPNIPRRVVCVSGEGSQPSGACHGDSGGPLIINGILAGIFSHLIMDANHNCLLGTPSIYTSVVDYLPWIISFVTPGVDTSNIQVQPEL